MADHSRGEVMETPIEVQLAIGRLVRILSRPEQAGDVETYHHLRQIILDASPTPPDHAPSWARDRLNGAQGG